YVALQPETCGWMPMKKDTDSPDPQEAHANTLHGKAITQTPSTNHRFRGGTERWDAKVGSLPNGCVQRRETSADPPAETAFLLHSLERGCAWKT
ncbi:hypothetical protein JOQ06_015323, partial [Pogonophryne albipinna]